jgi:hypothetical protein
LLFATKMITTYCIVAASFFAASIATAEKPCPARIALLSAGWPVTVIVVAAIAWRAE